MKFGDILRYPDDQGVGDDILFLHLTTIEHGGTEYHQVMVLRTTEDDDAWAPGILVVAGTAELIPYE